MFGEAFIGSLLSVVLGTLIGSCISSDAYPYLDVIYTFSTHMTIYSREKRRVEEKKDKDKAWTVWNYFSLLRNYFVIVAIRGLVNQVVEAVSAGRWETYDFMRSVQTLGPFIGSGLMCLIVMIAFDQALSSMIVRDVIACLAILTRATHSVEIFKRQKNPRSLSAMTEMTKQNVLNGASTTITMTIVDLLFMGDISILSQWIGIRSFFLIMPFLQTYYKALGLHGIHLHVVKQLQDMAKTQKIQIANMLGDGILMMTLFMYLSASFIVAPTIRSLLQRSSKTHTN